jgi:hypothetical protein
VRTAQLRGPDHVRLAGVAAVAEGPVALALSRGGARKRYAHKEPNEDVLGFAWSEWGRAVAVADGHAGSAAACLAIERVITHHVPPWLERAPLALDARFGDEVAALLRDVHTRILADAAVASARTTLALALARPREGWLGLASIGDSLLFCASDAGTRKLDSQVTGRTPYLGTPKLDAGDLIEASWMDVRPLRGLRSVVLASDGFSQPELGVRDPESVISQAQVQAGRETAELRPLALARDLAGRAVEAQRQQQSGDNVACAVLWLAL